MFVQAQTADSKSAVHKVEYDWPSFFPHRRVYYTFLRTVACTNLLLLHMCTGRSVVSAIRADDLTSWWATGWYYAAIEAPKVTRPRSQGRPPFHVFFSKDERCVPLHSRSFQLISSFFFSLEWVALGR